jgi:hypothetical protein
LYWPIPRFPNILPITEPKIVAAKLIEGLERNYEHVYVPAAIQAFGTIARYEYDAMHELELNSLYQV